MDKKMYVLTIGVYVPIEDSSWVSTIAIFRTREEADKGLYIFGKWIADVILPAWEMFNTKTELEIYISKNKPPFNTDIPNKALPYLSKIKFEVEEVEIFTFLLD